MSTISLRLNDEDSRIFRKYAELHGISLSDFIRQTVMERIEDEYGIEEFKLALAEFEKNPVTYSHEQVLEMFKED